MAVAVKAREEAFLVLRVRKIDNEYPASRSEHAMDFTRALLARFAR